MSRLLLQMVAGAVNAAPAAAPAPHANNSGMARSGVIYTFTFIGASVLAGLLFLGLMFKYMITYRMWGPPITLPLQPTQKKEEEYLSDVPNIKEVVVIRNPDGCASISIVREDEITDGRPPFLTYETMISKKAFADFSQKHMCTSISSNRSMTHAASASDLAGMADKDTATTSQKHMAPKKAIPEDDENAL